LHSNEAQPDPGFDTDVANGIEDTSSYSESDDEEEEIEVSLGKVNLNEAGQSEKEAKPKVKRERDVSRVFHLHFTLVICYLSCKILRIPVLIKDLVEYVNPYPAAFPYHAHLSLA